MKEVYRYAYHYAGRPVGEGRLEVERRRGGVRASLQAEFLPPLPPGRQRWQTELDAEGFSLRFQERVEGKEVRVFAVERLEEEGVVLVSQGKESLAYPYLAPYHDPLSLFLALPGLALEPGEVVRFPMPGGRVYVERLPDVQVEGKARRQYRLRPGLSLVQVEEGRLVRVAQQVGRHVFEAVLLEAEGP